MFGPLIQKIFSKFLFLFWLLVTSPPILLIGWFSDGHGIGAFGLIIILLWFLGSWWLTLTTSHYMFDKKKMFLEAVKCTLIDLRFKLALIPVLGAWFTPDEDKTRNDDDDA